MPRPPRPDDLYRLRIATEPRLSPDGRLAVVTLQTVATGFDGYRHALWLVPTDGGDEPRQLTLGARHDRHPRFSPDGRTLAFISDRRALVEDEPGVAGRREGRRTARIVDQVHLLPLDGGEARRLTDLPRGVDAFEWSPDGSRLVVVTTSHAATRTDDDRRRGIDRTAERRRHATAVGLSIRRPARLHAQRRGLHLRQGRASVAGRRRHRRGDATDRRPRRGRRSGVVARRATHRVHLEPPARRRSASRRGSTSTSSTSRRGR